MSLPLSVDMKTVIELHKQSSRVFLDIYTQFITETQALLSTLEFSRASGDLQGIRETIHALKQSSQQMGAALMSYHAEKIEQLMGSQTHHQTIRYEKMLDSQILAMQKAYEAYKDDISVLL